VPLEPVREGTKALTETYGHTVLATPPQPWEALKSGGNVARGGERVLRSVAL
jgi:hypothetical protein